jgi:carboxylate-amine ligase
MPARRVGVEEELILGDAETGELRPAAREVLEACRAKGDSGDGASLKHEFYLAQVEIATRPHTDLASIRGELTAARSRVAEAGASIGVAPLAVPVPVLAAAPEVRGISPGDRYLAVQRHYGEIAHQSLMCALQVHVEVADPEEGVAVIDRVRPWVPVLVALSANSPFWYGADTGHASWRSRLWNLWPTSGPAEAFGTADAYHAHVQRMVACGAALDPGLINMDVRLSARYPTVEFRIADVCTDIDDALVLTALARALVTHFAEQARAGRPPAAWRVDQLRAAAWRAARFGLADALASPASGDLLPAADVVQQLLTLVAGPLEEAGDAELARRGLAALTTRGTGAARQRNALRAGGAMAAVVADLRERTLRF